MADIPEVDTVKAFFILLLGGVVASILLYAYRQTVKSQIDAAVRGSGAAVSPGVQAAGGTTAPTPIAPLSPPGGINAVSY